MIRVPPSVDVIAYRDLEDELGIAIRRLQGVQNGGKLGSVELDYSFRQRTGGEDRVI